MAGNLSLIEKKIKRLGIVLNICLILLFGMVGMLLFII
jgi:hypothetical protein